MVEIVSVSRMPAHLLRFAAALLGVAGIGACHAEPPAVDDGRPPGAGDSPAWRSDAVALVNHMQRERQLFRSSARMLPLMVGAAGEGTVAVGLVRSRSDPGPAVRLELRWMMPWRVMN